MSLPRYNNECWCCGITYNYNIFKWECPDCGAKDDDNPEYHKSPPKLQTQSVNSIEQTSISINGVINSLNPDYVIGIDPYRTDTDEPPPIVEIRDQLPF